MKYLTKQEILKLNWLYFKFHANRLVQHFCIIELKPLEVYGGRKFQEKRRPKGVLLAYFRLREMIFRGVLQCCVD